MSYQSALEAAGAEVLDFDQFGSYQGDWLALVRVDGVLGVAEGSYGSCSGCDAFEGEFGWNDEDSDDYQERLADFGRGYLPAWTLSEIIERLERVVADEDWGDYAEMLAKVKEWQSVYDYE